jgi:hypothetical protein
MAFDEQMEEFRRKAIEASNRTTIDSVMGIHLKLSHARISPLLQTPEEEILARVPDLLAIATWAWYELRKEAEREA